MSDEMVVNGRVPSDANVDITSGQEVSADSADSKIQNLMQKVSNLELEKQELIDGKQATMEKINELEQEVERSESEKKVLESVAARAAELEDEVSRLQNDLILLMTEREEANAELSELKGVVEELKKSSSEKVEKIEILEKERNLLLERVGKDEEKLKESENRIFELKKKIEGFEVRESGQKSERVKAEEDAKAKMNEKDDQIRSLKRMVDEFQSVIAKNRVDIERSKKEKEELEIVKNDLEALLKKSERKVKEMELKIDHLHRELEASEKINNVLKENMVEGMNGPAAVVDRGICINDEKKSLMGLKLEWPVIAATAGGIATLAVVYLGYARRR